MGSIRKSLEIIDELQAQLKGPVYGVLGNHDSIRMAPSMEAMGICMLFNECEPIVRDGQRIFLAGVDDPHFYRADDIEKAASQIPSRCLFDFVGAHAGSLQSSNERQIRSHVMRTYPRWSALPTRWNSDQAGGSIT